MSTDNIAAFLASMAAAHHAAAAGQPTTTQAASLSPDQLNQFPSDHERDGQTQQQQQQNGMFSLVDGLDFANMSSYFASSQPLQPNMPWYNAESGFDTTVSPATAASPAAAAFAYPYAFGGSPWPGGLVAQQPTPLGTEQPQTSAPPGTAAAAAAARKRTSKACENCRIRRTKCTGGTPCAACLELGLQGSCLVRQKARPKRALPKLAASSTTHAQSLDDLGFGAGSARDHALFVWGIERRLSHWAAEQGVNLDLTLPDTSNIDTQLSGPLPPLTLVSIETMLAALECIDGFLNFFDFLTRQRARDLFQRFHSEPEGLGPDQRAMVLACLALGRYRQREIAEGRALMRVDPNAASRPPTTIQPEAEEPRPEYIGGMLYEVLYFRWALKELDQWGSASPTALSALHILHTYVLYAGGPGLIRDINGRMAWQCRELQIHRVKSTRLFDTKDEVGKLFYATLHKDSWMATVSSSPPFFLSTDFDPHFPSTHTDANFGGSEAGTDPDAVTLKPLNPTQGLRSHPFLVQLTLLENEILTRLHADGEFNEAAVLEYEGKLGAWNKLFREDQKKRQRPLLQAFAEIRYLWLRIMLRAPLIDHPTLGLSSIATLARCAPSMLNAYLLLSTTSHLHSTWPEIRRITTASHLIAVCCIEREMGDTEAQACMLVAVALLRMLSKGSESAIQALRGIERLAELLGMAALTSDEFSLGTDEPDRDHFSFDYSLADAQPGPPT